MSVYLSLVVVVGLLAGRAVGQEAVGDPPGWRLVWADEFDYTGLPDPAKWDYEVGFVRNDELQYYTKGRTENVRVADGTLVIEGRKERFPNETRDPKNWYKPRAERPHADYTSGSIHTHGKAAWRYGRIEVRAKLPQGRGVWPAIWLLGDNIGDVGWPKCGEIDVMEFVGKEPQTVHGTAHFHDRQTDKHKGVGGRTMVEAPLTDFHVYAAEWHTDRIDFFFDGRNYFTFDTGQAVQADGSNPFQRPFYLILNLALGGSWGGEMDDAALPQRFTVDYVRVYERAP